MRSGELFAGVGGLGMAVDAVFGTTPAWFAEVDPAPSKVLAYRHPDVPNLGDVTKVDWSTTPRVQVLAGGFPCQDVSLAGRRKGMAEGTRSGLWSEFAKAIDEQGPDWIVIENVRGLLSAGAAVDLEPCPLCVGDDTGHVLRALGAVLGDLADLGFDAEWTGIRASDVGAPHGRFRVFILAWPAERTTTDAGGGRGRGWAVASGRGTRAWADAPIDGADPRDDGRLEGVTLLGTPRTSSSHGAGDLSRRQASTNIESQVLLLPTPVAQPSGNTPEDHLRKKPGREVITDLAIIAENGLIESGGKLLPTPDAYSGSRGGSQHPEKRRDGGHSVSIADVAERVADWGPYAAAIARWASVIGRHAPAPVRYDGKGGKPRLNPELTEWMMGWPAGHVTDPAIGLSRAEQLKACGNGVVPQQAAAALRGLLARTGVPAIREEVAA